MSDTRKKDRNWKIDTNTDGTTPSTDAHLAVLMDLRDELKESNRLRGLQVDYNRQTYAQVREMNRRLRNAGYLLNKPRKARAFPKA
jgi:hypothetical protein